MTQLLTSDSYIPTTSGAITLPSITNNGDGSVTVGTGVFYLHDAYPGESHVNKYTVSGATFTLVDGSNNYIYVDYNAGSPVLKQTTDRASFVYTTTATPVYTIYRNGTALTILDWDTSGTALPEKLLLRTINNKRFERDETIGGLILADSGSLHFTISAGTIWYGVNDQALTAVDSAVDTVKRYLWNGTAWTSSAVTTFENTYYQGPSGLVAVSTARYCITWVYRSVQSGKVAYTLLGTADYKLAEAQAAPAPSNVPPEISSTCVLVGRIIVAKSATTATEVDSAFITPFASAGGTGTTNHNDLAGRDATGCHPASSITNTPAGNIAATTVQAALNELDTEKAALSGATFTGGVSAPSFDSATLNLGTSTATQINLGTASTTQTVNIGTGSGTTTINLGGAGDTVNISGTLAYVNVTNMTVTDKLITLNKGGGASTGFSSGFEIEENSSITGYCRSTSNNVSWEIKAPGSTGIATLSPGASNVSVWHSGNLTNLNQLSNGPGYITSSGSCAYATTAGSAPASDVYAWAKATTKPSYTFSEIGSGAISATTGTFSGAVTASSFTGAGTGLTGTAASLIVGKAQNAYVPNMNIAIGNANGDGVTYVSGFYYSAGLVSPAGITAAAQIATTTNFRSTLIGSASILGNWSGAFYWGMGSNGAHSIRLGMVNSAGEFLSNPGDIGLSIDAAVTATSFSGIGSGLTGTALSLRSGSAEYAYNTTLLDLSSLNQSTWYPVTLPLPVDRRVRCRVMVALNMGSVPTWATHASGFTAICDWTSNGSGWTTAPVMRTIHNYVYSYANVAPVGGIGQLTNSNMEYIYLRGGGKYKFEADYPVTPTIQTSSYTNNSQTVAPTTTLINDVFSSATCEVAFATVRAIGEFIGSGAGLTGTASALSIGGTATNISGGSVSATTGSFSGVLTAPTAAAGTNTNQVATTAFVKAAIAAAGGSVTNNATTVTGTECTSNKMIHSGTAIVYGVIVTNTTNSARYFKLFSNTNIDDSRLFLKVEVPAGQTVSLFPTGGIPDTAGGYSGIYAFCTTGSSDTDTTYASSGDMFATILWA